MTGSKVIGGEMRRVAVTGIGVVSSIGTGKDAFWTALLGGTSGISTVSSFDSTSFPVHIGGEVKDFDPLRYLTPERAAVMGRATQMAIGAAKLAVADSGLDFDSVDKNRVGVSMGTTSGEPLFVEQYNDAKKAGGEDAVPAEAMGRYPCHTMPAHVALEFGAHGPVIMIPTACAAGNYAIGYGYDLIRTGRVDHVLAGGADACRAGRVAREPSRFNAASIGPNARIRRSSRRMGPDQSSCHCRKPLAGCHNGLA